MVNNYSYIISTIIILTVIVIASVQKNVFLVNPLTQSHGDGWDLWMCIHMGHGQYLLCSSKTSMFCSVYYHIFGGFLVSIFILSILLTHIIHRFLPWNHSFWPIHRSTAKNWMASRPISSAAAVAATSRLRFRCAQQPLVITSSS